MKSDTMMTSQNEMHCSFERNFELKSSMICHLRVDPNTVAGYGKNLKPQTNSL